MLTNATLKRIDRTPSGGAGATGVVTLVIGDSIALRICIDSLSINQRYQLGRIIEDADSMVYIPKRGLDSIDADAPAVGDQLLILPDGKDEGGGFSGEVMNVTDCVLPGGGGGGHLEIALRRV